MESHLGHEGVFYITAEDQYWVLVLCRYIESCAVFAGSVVRTGVILLYSLNNRFAAAAGLIDFAAA